MLSLTLVMVLLAPPTVEWSPLTAKSDTITVFPDLQHWNARFNVMFGPMMQKDVLKSLADVRQQGLTYYGFDVFSPDATLPHGVAAFGVLRKEPVGAYIQLGSPQIKTWAARAWNISARRRATHELSFFPKTIATVQDQALWYRKARAPAADFARRRVDTALCLNREDADLWMLTGLPGRALDRGVEACTTVHLSPPLEGQPGGFQIDIQSSPLMAGILATLVPRTPDAAVFKVVGAQADSLVRVRVSTFGSATLLSAVLGSKVKTDLSVALRASFDNEIGIAWGPGLRILLKIKPKTQARLDALGPDWGGLRGTQPVFRSLLATIGWSPTASGYATIRDGYLILSDADLNSLPTGNFLDRFDPKTQTQATQAAIFAHLVDPSILSRLLALLPKQKLILATTLKAIGQTTLAVGIKRGFWMRFSAEILSAEPAPAP